MVQTGGVFPAIYISKELGLKRGFFGSRCSASCRVKVGELCGSCVISDIPDALPFVSVSGFFPLCPFLCLFGFLIAGRIPEISPLAFGVPCGPEHPPALYGQISAMPSISPVERFGRFGGTRIPLSPRSSPVAPIPCDIRGLRLMRPSGRCKSGGIAVQRSYECYQRTDPIPPRGI